MRLRLRAFVVGCSCLSLWSGYVGMTTGPVFAQNFTPTTQGDFASGSRLSTLMNFQNEHFIPGDVSFSDMAHGVLVGAILNQQKSTGVVFTTSDGGAHWRTLYMGGSTVYGVSTVGRQIWVLKSSGTTGHTNTQILHSNNGISFTNLPSKDLAQIHFITPQFGWGVTPTPAGVTPNVIVATRNGGHTWTSIHTPAGGQNGWIAGASFINAKTGWVLLVNQPGAGQQKKSVWMTNNGGRTWTETVGVDMGGVKNGFGGGGYGEGIDFVTSRNGWIWEARGSLLETKDGGKTWAGNPATHPETYEATDVSFLDALHGFAIFHDVEKQQMVLRSTIDGGRTWRTVSIFNQN